MSPQQAEKKQKEGDGDCWIIKLLLKETQVAHVGVGSAAKRNCSVRETLESYKVLLCSGKGQKSLSREERKLASRTLRI